MTKTSTRGTKREQVSNACTNCRISKLKCNGKHPTCYRCFNKDLLCVYDVSEGMTKRQHLNHELVEQKHELERATAVLRVLQYGTDQEATASLARLRFGSSIKQEFDRLHLQIQLSGSSSTETVHQAQLPTPATEYPEGLTPWCCSNGSQMEWSSAGAERMDWANPISPISQPSSVTANSTAESPFLDMTAATPGSNDPTNDPGDDQHRFLGG